MDQRFLSNHDFAKDLFVRSVQPMISCLVRRIFAKIKGPAAKDPTFDQVRVNICRFPDRKIALIYGPKPLRLVFEPLLYSGRFKKFGHFSLGLIVNILINTVPFKDRKPDPLKCLPKFRRKLPPTLFATLEKQPHITGLNPIVIVKHL